MVSSLDWKWRILFKYWNLPNPPFTGEVHYQWGSGSNFRLCCIENLLCDLCKFYNSHLKNDLNHKVKNCRNTLYFIENITFRVFCCPLSLEFWLSDPNRYRYIYKVLAMYFTDAGHCLMLSPKIQRPTLGLHSLQN